MKILLRAFQGKLESRPIDVPDNTSPDFYMPMPIDTLVYVSKKDSYTTSVPVRKQGHFRKTRMSWRLKDFSSDENVLDEAVYEYILTDIS